VREAGLSDFFCGFAAAAAWAVAGGIVNSDLLSRAEAQTRIRWASSLRQDFGQEEIKVLWSQHK